MSEQTGEPVFEGDVLLCEDNKMNQDLIRNRLMRAGLKTTVVENGKEGVGMVFARVQDGRKPFDLIFMDIYMPIMDGFEAASEIGKLNTGTPIIAISANTDSAEQERYLACGMSNYMNKPFTKQELSACLLRYLKPQTGEAANRIADNRSDEELKIKLINNFLAHNKTAYYEITKAIEGGDIKLAHRLAHTLKTNAGILGKARLKKAAEDVEALLVNEENRINQDVLAVFKTELDAVLEELSQFKVEEPPPVEKVSEGSLSEAETGALFDELEVLLDGGSTECLNLIGKLRMLPESAQGRPMVGELIRQMEYFEFDKAMETLARLKQNKTGNSHE